MPAASHLFCDIRQILNAFHHGRTLPDDRPTERRDRVAGRGTGHVPKASLDSIPRRLGGQYRGSRFFGAYRLGVPPIGFCPV